MTEKKIIPATNKDQEQIYRSSLSDVLRTYKNKKVKSLQKGVHFIVFPELKKVFVL